MLLRITSDLHMEQHVHSTIPFGFKWDEFMVPPKETDKDSVLVLAGDICEFGHVQFYANAWRRLSQRFKKVVWVPGNHEYWGVRSSSYCLRTYFHYKELLRSYGNIFLLDDTGIVVDGVYIYGATLWTDYNLNPLAVNICSETFGDFRHSYNTCTNETRLTRLSDFIARNKRSVDKLRQVLAGKRDVVVVSHFAPSHQSIHEKYRDVRPWETNLHYVNNLDMMIAGSQSLKLWVHGHTHTQHDYTIGQARVVCNPRGFSREDVCRFADLDVIEVT